jgi:hypothetical protein
MATQEYAASIQGVSIRVTRLDSAGNLKTGDGDSYTTSAFIRCSFTPEYEEGDEITEKSANGSTCVTYKSPDTLKRISMEVAICEPDVELTELLSGGLLLRKNTGTYGSPTNLSVGYASPGVGDDPAAYGVAIEVWTNAVKDGKRASVRPYFYWVFPYVKLRLSGDRVIENGMLATTFQGYGLGNSLFNDGPDDRWEFPTAAERPYSYARAAYAPIGYQGFYNWHGTLTATASNKLQSATLGTITFATQTAFKVGDVVTLASIDANMVGDKTITAVSATSPWTINYAGTAMTVVATASTTGTVTCAPAARTVSDFTGQSSTTAYNVPGNRNFNADQSVDYIIASNLDPTV